MPQDHGAVGDGMAMDTLAIQAAVDACAKNKDGGVVVFGENAQYLSGQITVKDGVLLRIPKGTTILAGTKVHFHFLEGSQMDAERLHRHCLIRSTQLHACFGHAF